MDRRTWMRTTGGLLGGLTAAQVVAGSPAAAEPQPVVSLVNVREYGAVGDGSTDDTAAFRLALDTARAGTGGAVLLVPPGSYPLSGSLRLDAGTTVLAHGAHLFRTGDTSALLKNHATGEEPVAKYEGTGGITVLGGTWDMRGSRFHATCPAFVFTHAEDFVVRDVTILDVPEAHAIELNAVRRVRIEDCLFDGVWVAPGTPAVPNRHEAVQITGATNAANLPAPQYDGTPCQDVLISGCTMRNSTATTTAPYDALCGDHYVAAADGPRPLHRGIRVLGNRIESSGAYGIRATDWQQSVIAGNTVESPPVTGIHVSSGSGNPLEDITVTDNIVRGAGSGGGIVVSNAEGVRNSGITVIGNTVRDTHGETGIYVSRTDAAVVGSNTVVVTRHPSGGNAQGIQLQESPHARVTGNHVSDTDGDGIAVDTGSTGVLLAHNTVLDTSRSGLALASSDIAARDNRLVGTGSGPGTYAVRVGGNAVGVSCQGNVSRPGEGDAAEAAIGVMAGSRGTWITANDLRGWEGRGLVDKGAGTVANDNPSVAV